MIVYRSGSSTPRNLTPRPGKDVDTQPGRRPGLSLSITRPTEGKCQKIDTSLLAPPLHFFPDDPTVGGSADHGTIAPVDETGEVDAAALEAWAQAARRYGNSPFYSDRLGCYC